MNRHSRRRFLSAAAGAAAPAAPQGSAFPPRWSSAYRVDPRYPHHLVNSEGRRLFLLNKTAWAFFACRDPEGFLQRAAAQGITVIRVALEGRPYFDQLGFDLWPWAGSRQAPDWSGFHEPYWEEVERRIQLAGEAGLGLDLVLYFTLHPEARDFSAQRPYLERALQRLGRFPNIVTWEIANEYLANEEFQDLAGQFLAEQDPLRRPVCTSDGTTDDAAWPDKPWVGLSVVHTCTGSTPEWPLDSWYQSVARNVRAHGKPAFNNESGREKRHRNDDPVHRRKQSWIWCCSGAYWTYHSWEGCEGIDDPNYRGPGSEFLKALSDYFQALPFWRLDPNYTALRVDASDVMVTVLATPSRDEVVAYVCTRVTNGTVSGLHAALRLPAGEYQLTCTNPRNLAAAAHWTVRSEGLNRIVDAALPEFQDDLVIRIQQSRRFTGRRIRGTG